MSDRIRPALLETNVYDRIKVCQACQLRLGTRPRRKACREESCGCRQCASWWWDFDPETDMTYCGDHLYTTPEAWVIMAGDEGFA